MAVVAIVAVAPLPLQDAGAKVSAKSPRVVWHEGDRFYVASPDSGAIATGMVVRVLDRGREIARGEATRVIDGRMASVRITGGVLGKDGRLDRLEVRIDPAAPMESRALRLGFPAPSRSGLAFACADAGLDLTALPRAYLAETLGVDSFRLLAADSGRVAMSWPETLLVRLYGDRADEEIALERGELDVAVFWPGEPSARLRESASGFETLLGDRGRGVLAALVAPQDSTQTKRIAPDMAALNAEMFGGDLRPWAGSEPVIDTSKPADSMGPGGASIGPARDVRGPRYTVDDAMPGRRPIERFLARRGGAPARPDDRAVRLTYVDVPVAPADSLESAWRERGMLPLFTVRCPVTCGPEVAGTLRVLGADAFANLLRCGAGGHRP